ncbi:glycosyltransferase [uncultured Tenacibaculum sp.]|uniref:glycosyltransferase n=1 Tax=uncultured Tenacibaculum sp. TaxID=174713 RepID=UPI0026236FAA|nr:glycosyltransferase [uncultured Tenacibaculum sp.]
MRIGMLLNGSYPADIRVRKEAETLAENHDVFILCKRISKEKSYEVVNGVHVFRKIEYKSLAHEGIIDVLTSINFIHPYFKKKTPIFIKENNIEALHVHDLPLAKTALIFTEKYNLKSILDLHENYPAALITWFAWRRNPIIRVKNKLLFGYKRWSNFERRIIKKYDVLVAVVDEMKQRLINQYGVDENRIVVVPNTEKKEFAENFDIKSTNYFTGLEDRFIISYVGGFGPHRGIHTAILGMNKIIEKFPNTLLVLVGPANYDVRLYLQNLIKEHKLEDFVIIKDKEPFKNVVNIMKSSQLNIIPHISNEQTESAMPHKFFQILLSGKPLLVSDCAPMKRIVEEKEIGSCFEAENPISFADKVFNIQMNYQAALDKAKKGNEEALVGNLNWEFTSKELIALYDRLSD